MKLIYSQICYRLYANRSGLPLPTKAVWLSTMVLLFCFSFQLDGKETTPTVSTDLLENTLEDAKVSGTVVDTDGIPLIGVNIVIKGTSGGTVTDVDGSYSLDVPDGGTLVFSYTGYKTIEIAPGDRATVDVIMESDAELLDEVVVIGYGVVKKSDLTGSVASLAGSELTTLAVGNPTSAMQGKLSGVQVENNGGEPGGAANVFVRGVSSLTNSFPLYVIDGTFADNMNFLNPNDIERIEVLKDASAAAIYGSRAANGVVIIQTKRGGKDAPRVQLNIRGGVEAPSKYLDFLNGADFVAYRNQREANDGTGFTLTHDGTDTDWQDLALNPGGVQDYGISFSGGDDNSKYYISGNYYNQDGILVASGFERYNLRANSEFDLGRFKVQQSLGITKSEIENNIWFGRDGTAEPSILRENVPENDGGFEAPSFDKHGFAGLNKYGLASLSEHTIDNTDIFGNLNFSYELAEGLVAKINFGADLLNTHVFAFRPTFFMSESDAVDNVNQENDLTEIRSETLLTLVEPTLS